MRRTNYKNRDVSDIGRIVDRRAVLDDSGDVVEPATYQPGHWVVTAGPVADWEKFRQVTADADKPRVFAGNVQATTVYKFPSEAAFKRAFEPKQADDDAS